MRLWMFGGGLAALLASHAVRADQMAALYSSAWAGLPSGTIRFGLTETGDAYQAELAIETAGLSRWFTHFRADVADRGRLAAASAIPAHYDAHFDLRKRHDRLISFTFVPSDDVIEAERDPNDTSEKPQLAAEFRRNVLDPLSTLLSIRQWLKTAKPAPGDTFRFPVYDGARRFDVEGRMLPEEDKDGLLQLQLTLKPIAGFKGESSQEGDPDSAPRPLRLALARDTLLPVSMRVLVAFMPFTVRLERLCSDFAHCSDDPEDAEPSHR